MIGKGNADIWRPRLVTWLSWAAVAHVILGLVAFFFSDHRWADNYHRTLADAFWPNGIDFRIIKREQAWWVSLFGATLECLGIWMLALVRYAGQHRIAAIWLWLTVGLLVWAPQDMFLSWQAGVTVQLVADALALLTMVPALLLLWRWDRVGN